jgi:hypothetical protein
MPGVIPAVNTERVKEKATIVEKFIFGNELGETVAGMIFSV